MTYSLTINCDTRDITRLLNLLASFPAQLKKAQTKAVRETLKAVKSQASEAASQEYAMNGAKIRKAITLYPSSGTLKISGTRKNLSDYRVTPKHVRNPQKGIRGQVFRRGGMKSLPHGFLIHGRGSGKILAMIRVGKGRKSYKAVTSPAIPQMMENENVDKVIRESVQEIMIEKLRLFVGEAIMK